MHLGYLEKITFFRTFNVIDDMPTCEICYLVRLAKQRYMSYKLPLGGARVCVCMSKVAHSLLVFMPRT